MKIRIAGWLCIILAIVMELCWLVAFLGAVAYGAGGGRSSCPSSADFVINHFMGGASGLPLLA